MTALIFCTTGLYFFFPNSEEVMESVKGTLVTTLLICIKSKLGFVPKKKSIVVKEEEEGEEGKGTGVL